MTIGSLLFAVVIVWAAPRLWPHVGAVIGVRSGADMVPAYSYLSLTGAPLDADSLRGRVVLVNFWATWCLPCRAEMPLLEQMHSRHRDRGVTYPIAHVGSEAERAFGGVRGYPTSFLLDRAGRIRHTVIGPIGPLSLEPAVRRLLAEP